MKLKLSIIAFLVVSIAWGQEYPSEEISFSNGEIILSGTLSFPNTVKKKSKAVVLVSGSGGQDRDSNVFGFKIFKILADFFNSEGYAVLRYDERGIGKSTGKSVGESTSAELAEDVQQAYLYLKNRKDIDPNGIGLLGHSEGGIIVPMVAVMEPEIDFIIIMAGFGVRGIELSAAQGEAIQRSSGMNDEFVEASTAMNRKILEMMIAEGTTEEALAEFTRAETEKLIPLMPSYAQSVITDKEAYLDAAANGVIQQFKNTWMKFYMAYDPLPTLKKVKCDVLMLFGELDTQVLPSQNKELMETALKSSGNSDVVSVTVPKANHLFQEAETGSPSEYMQLKKELSPLFFEEIRKWIEENK